MMRPISRVGNKRERSLRFSTSFPPNEDIFEKLLSDESMWSRWTLRGSAIKTAVDGVQLGTEFTSDVEPPIADEHCLTELCTIWAKKGRLAAVYVAVMPRLASCFHVREEAWVWLVVAVEIRVGNFAKHWIIRACSTCKFTREFG